MLTDIVIPLISGLSGAGIGGGLLLWVLSRLEARQAALELRQDAMREQSSEAVGNLYDKIEANEDCVEGELKKFNDSMGSVLNYLLATADKSNPPAVKILEDAMERRNR